MWPEGAFSVIRVQSPATCGAVLKTKLDGRGNLIFKKSVYLLKVAHAGRMYAQSVLKAVRQNGPFNPFKIAGNPRECLGFFIEPKQ